MVFECQRDSFVKEFDSTIVSSVPAKLTVVQDGKKVSISGYEVVCQDTILFPEGGGQNDDRGWLNGAAVLQVKRRGPEAIHFVQTDTQPEVGKTAHQVVDWERRFDHMQQHSGQHLISALFEKVFNIPTMSWWLAENSANRVGFSFVELGVETLTREQIDWIESEANAAIQEHLSVNVKMYQPDDPELDKSKTRGLPEDVSGPIRVIEIENGLDSNLCCGTHVTNLSQFQVIKLLNVENSKRKGNVNLNFLVGNRVLKFVSSSFDRERKITEILSGGVEEHIGLIEKLSKNVKSFQKSCQTLAKEVAMKDAQEIRDKGICYFSCHRSEAVGDYISVLVNELAKEDVTLLLTSGDEKGSNFQLVLTGPEAVVSNLGPKILESLEAKGGGKGRRLNAKFSSLKRLKEAEAILKEFFAEEKSTEG